VLSWWEWLPVAFRALRANLLRSILTMLGIIIGVAAVITMVAIGSGAQALVAERIRSLGANLLLIQPGSQRSGGARLGAGTRHTLTEDDAAAILREVPVVTVAAPAVQGPVQVVRGNRNWTTTVVGAVPDHLVAREWPVRAGRPFTLEELAAGAKVVLLGATVAEQLYGPDEDAVGTEVRLGTVPLTVIGVLERKGQSPGGRDQDDLAIAPLLTAKLRLVGGAHKVSRDAIGFIYIKVVAPEAMAVAQEQVEALLRQRHRIGPGEEDDFMIQDLAALVEAQQGATRTFTWLLAAVASVSLLVGGISIMNIMLVSVTERTREIGLRLAVGWIPERGATG
jgi:putative ABC transport system permease protein